MAEPNLIQSGPGGVPLVEEGFDQFSNARQEFAPGIQPDKWQKFWTDVAAKAIDAPTLLGQGAGVRYLEQNQLNANLQAAGRTRLTPEQANQSFPGLPKPFSEPVYPEVAKLIWDLNEKRKHLDTWKSRGPELGYDLPLVGNTAEFAASAITLGLDPLNIVVGGLLGAGTRALGLAGVSRGVTARGLTQVYAENFAGNVIGDLPRALQARREQQQDVTLEEIVRGAAAGAVVGTGIHVLLARATRESARSVETKAPEEIVQNTKNVINQMEHGAAVDVRMMTEVNIAREAGLARPGVQDLYSYRELSHPSEVHYYTTGDNQGGLYGVDNPQHASNRAASPESAAKGEVIQFSVDPSAQFVSGDASLNSLFGESVTPKEVLGKIKTALGDELFAQHESIFEQAVETDAPLSTVYNTLSEQGIPVDGLAKTLNSLGYDGVSFTGKMADSAIDNRVWVFNTDNARIIDVTPGDSRAVPELSSEQQQRLQDDVTSPERATHYDEDLRLEGHENATYDDSQVKPEVLDPNLEAELQLAEQNLKTRIAEDTTGTYAAEMESIEIEYKKEMKTIEAAKALAKCMGESAL